MQYMMVTKILAFKHLLSQYGIHLFEKNHTYEDDIRTKLQQSRFLISRLYRLIHSITNFTTYVHSTFIGILAFRPSSRDSQSRPLYLELLYKADARFRGLKPWLKSTLCTEVKCSQRWARVYSDNPFLMTQRQNDACSAVVITVQYTKCTLEL